MEKEALRQLLLTRAPIGNGQQIHKQYHQSQHEPYCQDQEDMRSMIATKAVPSDG